MAKPRQNFILTQHELYTVCVITLCVILINYVAYYADDLVFAYQQSPHTTLLTDFFQVLSYPVTVYVEGFEKKYFIDIFFVGRVVNYFIEMAYFFVLTTTVYFLLRKIILWVAR